MPLGVMLYEMLTGKTPFTGHNPFAIMNDRLLNNPVPPREWNPEISPELQEIIYRALERDPKNRYSTAHEFAWDLEHLDQVGVEDRAELQTGSSAARRGCAGFCSTSDGADPGVIFGLLLPGARPVARPSESYGAAHEYPDHRGTRGRVRARSIPCQLPLHRRALPVSPVECPIQARSPGGSTKPTIVAAPTNCGSHRPPITPNAITPHSPPTPCTAIAPPGSSTNSRSSITRSRR